MKRSLVLGVGTACLALLLVVGTAEAQRRGGGGGFGGMGGGWGGFSPGGSYGGWGGNWGGYNMMPSNYGYNNYGWGNSGYLGGRTYNPNYGYGGNAWGPAYGANYVGPGYVNNGYYPGVVSSPGYFAANQGTNQSQSFYSGPGQQQNNSAVVHVMVPPDAQVWFDGQETRQRGSERIFFSPPLDQGMNYSYSIKAAWNQNGQQVQQDRTVRVTPGQEVTVNFMADQGQNQGQQQLNVQQRDQQQLQTQPNNPPQQLQPGQNLPQRQNLPPDRNQPQRNQTAPPNPQ